MTACCEVGPNACRLLRLQGEDCCPSCIHPRDGEPALIEQPDPLDLLQQQSWEEA